MQLRPNADASIFLVNPSLTVTGCVGSREELHRQEQKRNKDFPDGVDTLRGPSICCAPLRMMGVLGGLEIDRTAVGVMVVGWVKCAM